jgi:outer membrane cobalamin receptor
VFAGIENVFDKDYEEFPGYTMPGIGVFGGMKVGF